MNLSPVYRKSLSLILFLSLSYFSPHEIYAQELEWPREIQAPNASILIYQPQPESFKGNHVTARSAVSVTLKDSSEPVFGAAWYDATVSTDRDKRTVRYLQVKVTEVKFPDATEAQEEKFKEIVSREMTGWNMQGSLDRLLTTLELADKEEKLAAQLNNDPPKIFYSEQNSVLVLIDGKPILKPVEGSAMQQVVNTAFQIFYDPEAKTYFLKGDSQWYSASEITGEWKVASQVPEAVSGLGSSVDSTVPSSPEGTPPEIFVSEGPAELIQVTGSPEWVAIPGTDLSYVKNSETDLFKQGAGEAYYALLSGRWFETKPVAKSATVGFWQDLVNQMEGDVLKVPPESVALGDALSGSWTYVSPDKLPEDFRKIPPDENDRLSGVLASIPGTDEAKDAAMDAQIPQTAVIDKKNAKFTPTYDGDPEFKDVSGTDLKYAVNTPNQIIKEGDKYYACDQGVWYVADNPDGPYKVSDSRPKNIDQLPPDNPNYNTKYVYVYDSNDNNAWVGYTAGYLGSFILGTALGATLNWGSGYYYPGWYGRYYYPRPWTYGYRAYYNPYTGGWGYRGPNGGAWYRPNDYWRGNNGYWGPGGYRQVNVDNVNINRVNIDRNQFNNNLYDRRQNIDRNVDRNRLGQVERDRLGSLGDRGPKGGRDLSKIQGNRPNNVFADKNGNVFRKDSKGQWERNDGGKWSKAKRDQVQRERPVAKKPSPRPAPSRDVSFNRNQMERQSYARERGNQRAQNFQRHSGGGQSFQRGGGGGGGRRGGGGGRRR